MMITPETPFRLCGDTDATTFARMLSRDANGGSSSPMGPEAAAVFAALPTLTRLAAAMAWHETKNFTFTSIPAKCKNPWAVKGSGPGGWARFNSFAEAAAAWKPYILGPTYADLTSVRQFIMRYAPPSENDVETYLKVICDQMNAMPEAPAGPGPAPAPGLDPWRPYPYPTMEKMIVQKPYDGAGFDRCAFRRPLIRGFCTHITDGGGTIEGIKALFEGERATDALTDLVIGRDGRIGLLNDWRDPNWGGTRAGWANGGVNGLEGDGVAYYRKFPDININLVSCEHIATSGQGWTDAMIASTIEVRTAIAQELQIPAAAYPVKPEWGVSSEQQHRNFATKSCPAEPYISTVSRIVLRAVKQKLADWQGASAVDPDPTPAPTPVVTRFTRFGFTLEQVAGYWGTMLRYNSDGTTTELPFNPEGPLSLFWLDRCDKEGRFPESEEIHIYDAKVADGKELFATWEGGWVAWLPVDNQRAGWTWLDGGPK